MVPSTPQRAHAVLVFTSACAALLHGRQMVIMLLGGVGPWLAFCELNEMHLELC